MVQYQWERFVSASPCDIDTWTCDYGPRVEERHPDGTARKVRFRVLIDNPDVRVFLVGPFNNWGRHAVRLSRSELEHDEHSIFAEIVTGEISHRDPYKLLIKQDEGWRFLQDPAGVYFDDEGNTIFWDFGDPSCYTPQYGFRDTIHRTTRIMQTDLPGLIAYWWDATRGQYGSEAPEQEYYRFITESGIIPYIKQLGFNTIQFLPFAQSIDGTDWKYRYLVPFQFAIQKNWGNPDEFARMIDEFHKHDIAVIGDFVLGHLPFKDFEIFGQSSEDHGIHQWRNRHGTLLYLKEETNWGTMRVDFDNPYVREFFISSCMHFLQKYRIDGLRIDNVDGIIRYGVNGDGPERPRGRTFLRELNHTVYTYNPHALIHFEAHYFHEDNAKMLVVPFEEDPRALGATAYNSSRLTYYLHTIYMLKEAEKVSPWKIKEITSEKEWGQSNSTVADFHNHDAAAGLMEQRCTGSYAYDALTYERPDLHYHAVGKIKVMEALIAFVTEGRILDLMQTFLLQTGTFEHDATIHWQLMETVPNRRVASYKQAINTLLQRPAFWPLFVKNRQFLNVDDSHKILVIERSATYQGKTERYVIIINLSAWTQHAYKVGVRTRSDYEVVLNADEEQYAGEAHTLPARLQNAPSSNFGLLDREVELPVVPPYAVVVLREIAD